MEQELYKITFADGTVISNLTINGSNYSSTTPVDGDILTAYNLSHILITDQNDNLIEEKFNQVLLSNQEWFGEYLLAFRDQTDEERRIAELDAKLEYIAMMGDIEL